MSTTPEYYIGKHNGIEAFDVVLDFQANNYNLGTAITYLLRAGKKPDNPITQDIEKAIAHLKKELEHQLPAKPKDEWSMKDFVDERYKVLKDKHNFIPEKVVDIGASYGDWFKDIKTIYPDADILSIEGNPIFKEKLTGVNSNCIIVCLGREEGETNFYVNNSNPYCCGASVYKEQTKWYNDPVEMSLPVVTLDSLNKQFDLIKMDVQGSELDIIKGGINTIKQASVLQIELGMLNYNQGAPKASEVISYLYNIGFDLFDIGSFHYWDNKLNQTDMFFLNRDKINIGI